MTQSEDRVTKPSDRGFWGRKTEGQASFGVDLGSLRGDPGETLGGRGSPAVTGGRKKRSFPGV